MIERSRSDSGCCRSDLPLESALPGMVPPSIENGQYGPRRLSAHQGEDITVRILEPCRLGPPGAMDVSFAGCTGKVVVLEANSFSLEVPDQSVEILHCPGYRGGLVGTGELGLVDQNIGAPAPVSYDPLLLAGRRLQPKGAFVELPGSLDISHSDS